MELPELTPWQQVKFKLIDPWLGSKNTVDVVSYCDTSVGMRIINKIDFLLQILNL